MCLSCFTWKKLYFFCSQNNFYKINIFKSLLIKNWCYTEWLYTICLPFFFEWYNSEEQHFIKYGASPNFALPVRVWLDNHFTGRWIGRGGTNTMASATSRLYSRWFLFVGTRQTKKDAEKIKTKHIWWTNLRYICTWSSRLLKETC